MAKKKKKKSASGEETPEWLITFSDVMTLLLTFFVLLLSMASMLDIKKKYLALGSLSSAFGVGMENLSILGKKISKSPELLEPGVMESEDLEPLKNLIWEDFSKDLDFRENKFIQVFSINAQLLFLKNSNELSPSGKQILKRITPVLKQVKYPVMIAGHTSLYENPEIKDIISIKKELDTISGVDASWILSVKRCIAVYTYLRSQGIPSDKLIIEAYGKYHPLYSNDTSVGRKKNRRVDFILDKRSYILHNPNKLRKFNQLKQLKEIKESIKYKGFEFKIPNVEE